MSGINSTSNCLCNLLRRSNNNANYNRIFVRFRKPRWLPKAPSKIYNVREPTPIDPVEYEKMKVWTNQYRTARKSLLNYMKTHYDLIEENKKDTVQKTTYSSEELFYMMEVRNSVWNAQTAEIRNEDQMIKDEQEALRLRKFAERDERELAEIREAAKLKVVQVKDWQTNYITEQNLDDALEELLNSRVNHEFAMNPDGTKTTDPIKTDAVPDIKRTDS